MVVRSRGEYRKQRRLVVILFAFVSTISWGMETASLELSANPVVKGNLTTIRILTNIPWGTKVLIQSPELTAPLVWWSKPYARPRSVSTTEGTFLRVVEVLSSIRVDTAGFHSLKPFSLIIGDQEIKTEEQEIIGLEPDEKNFPYPVVLAWRPKQERVWLGQTLPLVLEVKNLTSLHLADTVTLDNTPMGLLEQVSGFGEIITRFHGKKILYDIPMDSWIWTANEVGLNRFPGVSVSVAGLRRTIQAFNLEVTALPEEIRYSGAIGYLQLSVRWDNEKIHVGDIFTVALRVEGEGNLNVLLLPVPEMQGGQLVNQGRSSSYFPGKNGYKGWREDRYDFRMESQGQLRIPDWLWLEPEGEGRIRTRASSIHTLPITPASEGSPYAQPKTPLPLGKDFYRYPALSFHWNNPIFFLFLLPGFLIFLVALVFKTSLFKKILPALFLPLFLSAANSIESNGAQVALAQAIAENGNKERALEIYKDLSDDWGEFPGILHDMALLEADLGAADLAVWHLRRALFLRPGSRRLHDSLVLMEEKIGLVDQVAPSLTWSPAWVFVFWLVMLNALFLLGARLCFRRRSLEIISLIFISLLFILSTLFLIFTENRWQKPIAVLRHNAIPLRKIPDPLASDWIILPVGTSVKVQFLKDENYLVKTGYGLEGWLPQSSLAFVKEDENGF